MAAPSQAHISSVRRFNRFYTREVGVLRKYFLDTPWSLAEMRIMFEIANGEDVTASDIGKLGFVKSGEESHYDWGGKATSEFWDLDL